MTSQQIGEKGIELIYIGKIETHDECLLEILKDHGFYLHRKEMTGKFKDLEWYDILAKKEEESHIQEKCSTCRYRDTPAYEQPCSDCDRGNGKNRHWVAKEEK